MAPKASALAALLSLLEPAAAWGGADGSALFQRGLQVHPFGFSEDIPQLPADEDNVEGEPEYSMNPIDRMAGLIDPKTMMPEVHPWELEQGATPSTPDEARLKKADKEERFAKLRGLLQPAKPRAPLRLNAAVSEAARQRELKALGTRITDSPWKVLEKHGAVLALVKQALANVEAPVDAFVRDSEAFAQKVQATGGFEAKRAAAMAKADHMREEWHSIAAAIESGFGSASGSPSGMAGLVGQLQEVRDLIAKLVDSARAFTGFVDWYAAHSVLNLLHLGTLGSHLVPSQREVLRAGSFTFKKQKDAVLQSMQDVFDILLQHLGQDMTDSFTNLGNGTCLDATGIEYDAYEAPGCETMLDCMRACRLYETWQCHGVTFSMETAGCGRCELRMEDELDSPSGPWTPESTVYTGTGAVASADGAPGKLCYSRQVPEWKVWPELMRNSLLTAMGELSANYTAATRSWRSILFKVDRGFWEVQTAVAKASAAAA